MLWFSDAGDGVVGHVTRHRVRVVVGAPVCAHARLADCAAEFERDAARRGERVCYFGAGERLESIYARSAEHSMMRLGGQPAWDPSHWPEILRSHASLRAQLNRARNKGVAVAEWDSARAQEHPELSRCLTEWLAARRLPPMHFMVEPWTLSRLADRRVFVAERAGGVVAFLLASPVPERAGWLVEQIIRGRNASNGTAELMIDTAMRAFADEGARYITLGLAPLSRRSGAPAGDSSAWLRLLLLWIRAHGRRFYNFDGLDAFKAKFRPERWEPIHAVTTERRFSPRSLYAIAAAFADGSPVVLVARAMVRAAVQEGRWMARRVGTSR